MNLKKTMLIASITLGGLVAASFFLMVAKDQTYVPSANYELKGNLNREVAVIYYSRSGHSEAVAREVAHTFNASIAQIEADYPRSLAGQRKAVSDATAEALPHIIVEPISLAPVHHVFLVSPIWMFRPATPLWAYVEQTDLMGKDVVLVTTGNSRFKQAEINAFASSVEARGGRLIRHIFLRRGRFLWQKSREELLEEVRNRMNELTHLPF